MAGAPSHLELFDHKPQLAKFDGQLPPPDLLKGYRAAFINPDAKLLGPKYKFHKVGSNGVELSELLPHLATVIDDIAVVRSMWTSDNNHGAQTQFHSGRHMLDGNYPTVGAWVNYGLASLNDNLPRYISMGVRPYWNERDGH